MIQHHLSGTNGSQRIDDILPRVFGSTSADWLKHAGTFRIDVSACRDPHPALHHGTQVGDDVSEHVVGDNHIKPLGVLDKPHGGGIHVGIVTRDVREVLLSYFVEGTLPKVESKGQNVGLTTQG